MFTIYVGFHCFLGSCNGVNADDFKMVDGQITDNSDTFGKSWRVTDLPAG